MQHLSRHLWLSMAAAILGLGCSPTTDDTITPNSGGVSEAGASIGGFGGAPSGGPFLVDAALMDAALVDVGELDMGEADIFEMPINCESFPLTLNMGDPCHGPEMCGHGGVCTPTGICSQRCVPGEDLSYCGMSMTCEVYKDMNGHEVAMDGCVLGYCKNINTRDLGCSEVYMCLFDCEANSICEYLCYSRARNLSVSLAAHSLTECVREYARICETYSCFEENCGDVLRNCIPLPDYVENPGNNNCDMTWHCIVRCEADDAQCQTRCIEGATYQAYDEIIDLFDCVSPDFDGNWRRGAERCAGEWAACRLPPIGDASCADLLHCAHDRDIIDCALSASAEAVDQHQALIDCAPHLNICHDLDAVEQACPEAWAACQPKPMVCSEAPCAEIIACIGACAPGDGACFMACSEGGSRAARDAFDVAVRCVIRAGCNAEAQSVGVLLDASTLGTAAVLVP